MDSMSRPLRSFPAVPPSLSARSAWQWSGGYTGDLDAYRTFLTGLNGDRVSFEDDGNVPDGIDGVIASIDWTDRDGEPFSSMLRTWLTKDKTKITVAIVSAGAELDAGCDRAAIASTLQWAGGA